MPIERFLLRCLYAEAHTSDAALPSLVLKQHALAVAQSEYLTAKVLQSLNGLKVSLATMLHRMIVGKAIDVHVMQVLQSLRLHTKCLRIDTFVCTRRRSHTFKVSYPKIILLPLKVLERLLSLRYVCTNTEPHIEDPISKIYVACKVDHCFNNRV